MAGSAAAADLDGRGIQHTDVIVRGNCSFLLVVQGIDSQQAGTAENQLCLAEQNSLQIFLALSDIRGGTAVRECVGAIDHNKCTLLVLIVECSAIWIGNAHSIKDDSLLLGAIYLEEAIARCTGELIDKDFSPGIVDGNLVAINGDISICISGHGSIPGIRICNDDTSLERGIGNIII